MLNNRVVQDIDGGVIFTVKVVPGSSKTALCGLIGEKVKVKVAAVPEKGKANQCLVEFLAKQLGVKKSSISIIAGQTNPIKQVQVWGISADVLTKKLNLSKEND